MKKTFQFILLTLTFSFLLFFIEGYFFSSEKMVENEESYILSEKTAEEDVVKLNVADLIKEKDEKLDIKYFPEDFSRNCRDHVGMYDNFFHSDKISDKKESLKIELYENMIDVRGKMKNKTLKLFGVLRMDKEEFLSVSIHEFAHFVDLYFLDKSVFKDLSYYFYDISWESTKVIKAGLEQKDFVSGYAMTNKYEDFAESFTYYILHNKDFLEKSKSSDILKSKYDFFGKYLFRNGEFIDTSFSNGEKVKDYYRDITKIQFSLENFLQYLKK